MLHNYQLHLCSCRCSPVPGVPRGPSKVPQLSRIVGGVEAAPGEFPHQISLQKSPVIGIQNDHICGGSVYNENYIITAAHCVIG